VLEGQSALWHGRSIESKAVRQLLDKNNFYRVLYIGSCTKEAQERLADEVVSIISSLARRIPETQSKKTNKRSAPFARVSWAG
jgi:hypothetical protein